VEAPWVTWWALVPLLFAVRGAATGRALACGFCCGLTHYASALYWIHNVMAQYGGLPLPVAVVVLLLLCAYLAIYPAVFAAAARHWSIRPHFWLAALPCLWVALEWVRAQALSGFPWANLGYSQNPFFLLIQVADITGVYGVSWLLVLANTSIAVSLQERRVHWSLGVTALGIAALVLYGQVRVAAVERAEAHAAPWNVGVIQGNVDQALKWDPAFQQETIQRYRRLSLEARGSSPPPVLIAWPETAAPFFYGMEPSLTRQVQEIAREAGSALLFGSPGAATLGGKTYLYNRAHLIDAAGRSLGTYAKQHLVPFGEYVPLKRLLFFVERLVPAAGDFAAGGRQAPMGFEAGRLGALICYEAIFPELARHAVRDGATALVNITNDAWFGTSSAPYQHLEMARWRAIENRVPLIRAANTGISTVFPASGRHGPVIPLNETGYLVCAVRPVALPTVYTAWGNWFAWLCVLTTVLSVLYINVLR
jgi:apolipoprotein N-acyltransferase